MPAPTESEVFMKLIEDMTHVQEGAAMMGHLVRANASSKKNIALADGWLAISEMVKRQRHQVIEMAKGKLN